jgi:Fe-S-cluster-containing dehydrogenase component
MANYAAVVDVTKCIDCRCCVVTCKDEFALNDYRPYSAGMPFEGQKWVHVENLERGKFPKVKFGSFPVMCQHCDNAPCIAAATGGAVYKRPDGIVLIDPVKAKGQKQIVDACPYGVISWNEDAQIPQKCTLCAHRLDEGRTPRCMMACPADAIKIGDYTQIMRDAARYGPTTYHPEYKTQNRVLYIGLPKTFIAGALVDSNGECLVGATVTATDTAAKAIVGTTTSDDFGDFWFDGLVANKSYDVTISAAGKTKTVSVSLSKDTNLGDIQIA